jgi:hypothetical protein
MEITEINGSKVLEVKMVKKWYFSDLKIPFLTLENDLQNVSKLQERERYENIC